MNAPLPIVLLYCTWLIPIEIKKLTTTSPVPVETLNSYLCDRDPAVEPDVPDPYYGFRGRG